jgi:hypothetical protein
VHSSAKRLLPRPYALESEVILAEASVPVDFEVLTRTLVRLFMTCPPQGDAAGRANLRKAICTLMACSPPAAEQVLEALIFRGQLAFRGHLGANGLWIFQRAPARC